MEAHALHPKESLHLSQIKKNVKLTNVNKSERTVTAGLLSPQLRFTSRKDSELSTAFRAPCPAAWHTTSEQCFLCGRALASVCLPASASQRCS